MNQSRPEFRHMAVFWLIVTLGAIFLLQAILVVYAHYNVAATFGLSREGLAQGRVWQLLTFQFLHAAPWPWHVIMNCLGLYFFGLALEESHGMRRFLQLYFLGGTIGGIFEVAVSFLPQHESAGVVGASAGVMAVIAAYCTLNPWQEACFIFYFFPVRIKAAVVLWILLFLSLFGVIIPYGSTAHGAHLAGLLTGIAFARYALLAGDDGPLARFFPASGAPKSKTQSGWFEELVTTSKQRRASADETDTAFISKQVDPILDKISAHGIHSLTKEERGILERARSRMGKQ